jgi:hypothetical protein
MSSIDLSIIIINWNSVNYLTKCLETIYANTKGIDFEVIVVDNASFDGSGEFLAVRYPEIKFIQNKINQGFGNANNMGVNHSNGKYILFLNPDTEILGPSLITLLEFLKANPKAGAVGGRLFNTDGSLQTTSVQSFPTIMNQMLATDYLIRRFPGWEMWGVRPLFLDTGGPQPVQVVTGACLMVERNIFESVGMFSREYFMYGEDMDLCFKLYKAGRINYYIGYAHILHHGGKSADQASFSQFNTVHKRESIRIFLKKFKGPYVATLFTLTSGLAAVVRLILIFLSSPFAFLSRRGCRLKTTFQKWLTVLKWSIGGVTIQAEAPSKRI